MKMKAPSIRQPWAWLVSKGHKSVENRPRRTQFRGYFLIHASRNEVKSAYQQAVEFARDHAGLNHSIEIPHLDVVERGGIVGVAELVDVTRSSPSRWFVGPHAYILRNARALPFTPRTGQLGFFDIELDDYPALRDALKPQEFPVYR